MEKSVLIKRLKTNLNQKKKSLRIIIKRVIILINF